MKGTKIQIPFKYVVFAILLIVCKGGDINAKVGNTDTKLLEQFLTAEIVGHEQLAMPPLEAAPTLIKTKPQVTNDLSISCVNFNGMLIVNVTNHTGISRQVAVEIIIQDEVIVRWTKQVTGHSSTSMQFNSNGAAGSGTCELTDAVTGQLIDVRPF